MTARRRFSKKIIDTIDKSSILGVRAGNGPHRIVGIWAVVVERRVFARSWDASPGGWYQNFLREGRGIVAIDGRQIAVRAVRTRGERLKGAIDRAYAAKYNTPGSVKYVKGFRRPTRRDRTIEFVPLQ